jgi:hypothetical protein
VNQEDIGPGIKDPTSNETKFNGIVGMIQRNVRLNL